MPLRIRMFLFFAAPAEAWLKLCGLIFDVEVEAGIMDDQR